MEARNITIVSTKTQSRYVVNTDATTLRELKDALNAQNIDFSDMAFYEGLSHTELLTDDAVLPHDVPYKGSTTNELVFMLTNPNKKIKSGANLSEARQALYDSIEEMGLKDACVSTYGKNFTQCKNSELMSLIESAQEHLAGAPANSVSAALECLVDILVRDFTIETEDGNRVLRVLHGEDAQPEVYSQSEIDEMFNFLD